MATQQAAAPGAAAAQFASAHWRAAGMTYNKFASQCAAVLRKCRKEPFRTQTRSREKVHYKFVKFAGGQPQRAELRGEAAGTSPEK